MSRMAQHAWRRPSQVRSLLSTPVRAETGGCRPRQVARDGIVTWEEDLSSHQQGLRAQYARAARTGDILALKRS